jgi:hypothetical protein
MYAAKGTFRACSLINSPNECNRHPVAVSLRGSISRCSQYGHEKPAFTPRGEEFFLKSVPLLALTIRVEAMGVADGDEWIADKVRALGH